MNHYYEYLSLSDLPGEIWKPVKNYEGLYDVSNLGRIKSFDKYLFNKNGERYFKKGRIMKQSFTSTGYLMINLSHKYFKVHRLVAKAFLPLILNKNVVNHKDFDHFNNQLSNLEWCTQKENVKHAILHKRNKYYYYVDKEKAVELFKTGKTISRIAKEFNATKASVEFIIRANGISRKQYPRESKYGLSLKQLKQLFDAGYSNSEISKTYNIPPKYIGRRKYQFKKGEIYAQ